MDVNDLRSAITVLSLLAFLVICYWAYGPRSKHRFDDASNLPFAEVDDAISAKSSLRTNGKGEIRHD